MLWATIIYWLVFVTTLFTIFNVIVARYIGHDKIWQVEHTMSQEQIELLDAENDPHDFRSWDSEHDLQLIFWETCQHPS